MSTNNSTIYDTPQYLPSTEFILDKEVTPQNKTTLENELLLGLIKGMQSHDIFNKYNDDNTLPDNKILYDSVENDGSLLFKTTAIDTKNFIVKSEFSQNQIGENERLLYNIGTNTFNNANNIINKNITLSETSSSFLDQTLVFDNTPVWGPWNSVDTSKSWTIDFKEMDPESLLSLAINSDYNNYTGKSYVTIKEDVTFNTNYSFAKLNPNFSNWFEFLEDAALKLNYRNLDDIYIPYKNEITIDFNEDKMVDPTIFGTYKLVQKDAIINITYNGTDATPFQGLIIDNDAIPKNQLPYQLNQDQYQSYFKDNIQEKYNNDNYTLTIDQTYKGDGYTPDFDGIPLNSSDLNFNFSTVPFTLDSTQLIDNFDYMEGGYAKMRNQIKLTQTPITISISSGSSTDIGVFSISNYGEKLNVDYYNKNGTQSIERDLNTARTKDDLINTNNRYSNFIVNYENEDANNHIGSDEKIYRDVKYNVRNLARPVGYNQYSTTAISINDYYSDATLYLKEETDYTIKFSSTITDKYPDNVASYITVDVKSELTEDVESLLKLDDNVVNVNNVDPNDNNANPSIPVYIDIYSSGNNSYTALEYDSYRVLLESKSVEDLVQVAPTQNCELFMGLNNNENFLTTSCFSAGHSLFSSSEYYDFIKNGTDITLEFEYSNELTGRNIGDLHDEVKIYHIVGSERKLQGTLDRTNITFVNNSDVSSTTSSVIVQDDYQKTDIVLNTKTQVYSAIFQLKFGAYSNLFVKTGQLLSTISSYIGTSQSNGKVVNFPAVKELPTGIFDYGQITEEIVGYGTTTAYTSRVTFKASSVSSLIGTIQATNVDLPTWTSVSAPTSIDPYFDTTTKFASDLNYGIVSVFIKPHSDHGDTIINSLNQDMLILDNLYYGIPLNFAAHPNYEVKGYGYTRDDLSGFDTDTLFTPAPSNNLLPAAPAKSKKMNLALDFDYETYMNGNQLTKGFTLTIKDTVSNQTIATIESEITGITQSFTIFSIKKPIFSIDESLSDPVKTAKNTTIYVIGDETDSNGYLNGNSSGILTNNAGIKITYSDIQLNDTLEFKLKSDKLKINVVGALDPALPHNYFENLLWQYNNTANQGFDKLTDANYVDVANNAVTGNTSEVITIEQYRGFTSNATFDFNRINNKCKAEYNVNVILNNVERIKCNYGDIYTLKDGKYDTNYNNDIGSIALKMTALWSRMPSSFFAQGINYINVPIDIDADKISVTETYDVENATTPVSWSSSTPVTYTKYTTDYTIYTFPQNTRSIITGRVTNSVTGKNTYVINHKKGALEMYKSNAFEGSPMGLLYNKLGDSIDFDDGKKGIFAVKESMTFTPELNVRSRSTSYLVFAPPAFLASQASYNFTQSLPITQSSIDEREICNIRISAMSYASDINTYRPFSSFVTDLHVNDILFTNKNPKSYLTYHKVPESSEYTFNIKGSKTKIFTNLGLNNIAPNSSPAKIIYDGFIVDLPRFKLLSDPYKLEASLNSATGEYAVTFCQNILSGANVYENALNFNVNKDQNIKFVIGGQTFKNNGKKSDNVALDSNYINLQVYDGTTTSIYSLGNYISPETEVKPSEYVIRLLKLTTSAVQYDLLPIQSNTLNLNFIDIIPLPQHGVKYIDITMADLNVISGYKMNKLTQTPFNLIQFIHEHLNNAQFSSFLLGKQWNDVTSNEGLTFDPTQLSSFLFRIIATSNIGQYRMTDLFTVDENHNTKFTYISNPDILTVLSSDGLPLVRIAANGVISSQTNITNLEIINPLKNIIVTPLQNPAPQGNW